MNRNKFRNHYLKNLKEFMKKEQSYENSQSSDKKEMHYLDVEEIQH
jgi:hypothetical protein